ncbi:hypothetical protein JVX90_00130 [Gordonia sp. PDNC005]|uniref:hypothetical protein n=1 Tax=Gordonia sp. PDNC005 TaxID=2811424 RepID=UPI001962785D|nr:hypothetical protein [Gordonia sp. PDNC005]QRY62720.1 hypothetical protein JVX90_00130 [Gordonia sp. PDNC005]
MTPIELHDRHDWRKYATVELPGSIAVYHRTLTLIVPRWNPAYDLILDKRLDTVIRYGGHIWDVETVTNTADQITLIACRYAFDQLTEPWTFDSYLAAHATKENPMPDTIEPTEAKAVDDLYEQAINTYRVEYGETMAISHNERAVRAVVDYVLAAQPEQIDRKPYILRAAVAIVLRETGHNLYAVAELANRLEAERKAAQERAEQDRQIEVLAENTFEHITDTGFGTLSDSQQEKWREAMRRARTHILAEAVTE